MSAMSEKIVEEISIFLVDRGHALSGALCRKIVDMVREDLSTGIGRIAAERRRQIEVEGWTPEHDASHVMDELAWAAISYAAPYPVYEKAIDNNQRIVFCDSWPMNWERRWDKRHKHDRLRKLEIAGALIAAEIDRLERLNAKSK